MCGPTGVGVIYGKKKLLNKCKIVKFGGGMVDKIVDLSNIRYKDVPYCFEAGTPQIENILGFNQALRFYLSIGYDVIKEKNRELNDYFIKKLGRSKKVKLIFDLGKKHAPIFTLKLNNKELNIHYVAKILSDSKNICVSAGYQCCQPLYNHVSEPGGIRVSLQFYNTKEEIDYFFDVIDNLNI
jgi:cysteine desulfurase/selenocysteine lyase